MNNLNAVVPLVLAASTFGCAGQSPSRSAAAAIIPAWNSQTLFDPLAGFPDAVKAAATTEIGNLSFDELYQRLLPLVSDRKVAIDGVEYSDARTHLLAAKQLMTDLGTKYSRLSDAWAAVGQNPSAWSYAEFKSTLQALGGKASASSTGPKGLSLEGGGGLAPSPWNHEYCDPYNDFLKQLGVDYRQLIKSTETVRSYCGALETTHSMTSYEAPLSHLSSGTQVSVVAKCAEPANYGTIVITNPQRPDTFTDHGAYNQYCTADINDSTSYNPGKAQPATFTPDDQFWIRNNGGGAPTQVTPN